jgi:hydrogenase maturation protease
MLHVICFGNLWQGDDGFGIHVFRRLLDRPCQPRQVKLFDAGIEGLGALGYFEGCRKAVIVDALETRGQVGHVLRVRLDKLDPPDPEVSLHGFGIHHLSAALPAVLGGRALPEMVLIGAQIGEVRMFRDELTPPLQAAIDKAVRPVEREISGYARG